MRPLKKIQNPIFIIGTGRCGSTLFHDLFSYHPQLAWVSGFCNYAPRWPILNRMVLRADSHALSQKLMRRVLRPSEGIFYWDYLAPGFARATQDLKAVDVHARVKKFARREMARLLTAKRHRLLHKITGWPRTDYLLAMFPDAKFIHVYRDGRAVAHSFFTVKWWDGWRGPSNWICGDLPPAYAKEWEQSGRAFITLAAIQWKILMDAYEEAKKNLSSKNYLEFKYEEFTENPCTIFDRVLNFCDLPMDKRFERFVANLRLESKNDKWRKSLSEQQQALFQKSLAAHLGKYGY